MYMDDTGCISSTLTIEISSRWDDRNLFQSRRHFNFSFHYQSRRHFSVSFHSRRHSVSVSTPVGMIGVSSAPVATSVSTATTVATSVSSAPVATQFQFPLPLGMIGVSSAPVTTSVSVSIATPVATSISISIPTPTPTPVGVLDRSLLCRTTVSPTPVASSDTFTSSSSFISNAEVPIPVRFKFRLFDGLLFCKLSFYFFKF
jgi:hypothetical protein